MVGGLRRGKGDPRRAETSAELVKLNDHRAIILHPMEEEHGKEAAQRLELGAEDDNMEYSLWTSQTG